MPVIAVGPARCSSLPRRARCGNTSRPGRAAGDAREGFRHPHHRRRRGRGAPVVLVVGNDARGVLFGVGRLLRALRMAPGKVVAARRARPGLGAQVSAPRPSARLSAQDQLLRRLGPAAVGALHPRPGRLRHQRHRADPAPLRRRRRQPALSPAAARDDGRHVPDLRRLRPGRLDLVSGDGRGLRRSQDGRARAGRSGPRSSRSCRGSTPSSCPAATPATRGPRYLMALLEKQAANLRRFHPKAQMWVSPQSFSREWLDEFLALMQAEPAWLGGVVFGPQVRVSLPELRKAVPAKYPIRDYPDITHSLRCQYPVPDWDVAYSLTEGPRGDQPAPAGRGGDLPRVRRPDDRLHHLFRRLQRRRQQDRLERPGLGPGGRRARGPARLRPLPGRPARRATPTASPRGSSPSSRTGAGRCCPTARSRRRSSSSATLERRAPPRVLANWRFQQALYRAYYDAYVRSRLIYETDLEERALDRAARGPSRSARSWRWSRPRRSSTGPSRSRSPPTCARGSSSWPRRCFRAFACN